MGDEDTSESQRKVSQRRQRIIIRKCKKPSKDSVFKPSDESKKINGELQTGLIKSENENDIEIIEPNERDSKPVKKVGKRKAEEIDSQENDCSIIEADSAVADCNHGDENEEKEESLSVEFKGFKKRIIAQTEKLKDDTNEDSKNCTDSNQVSVQQPVKAVVKAKPAKFNKGKKKNDSNGKKNNEADGDESQAESQAEYAQYLGLQPTMQFKCYRCGEKGFPSMLALNMHQRSCGLSQKTNFLANLQQDTTNISSSDPNMLTNFRITRKVYLCSACGTYYENWNLFLHMRDVHKKHICLYCLTMFTVANKLADHLQVTHSVQENNCKTNEEFQNIYKGSCYLICCSCENMFTERDDYHQHECEKKDPTAKCPLCGVKCGHYYTCPNSNLPRTSTGSVVTPTSTINKPQLTNPNKPVNKNTASEALWSNKKSQGGLSSDNDEDYDISHAASFCHVDIADESGEKNKMAADGVIDISDDDQQIEINKTTRTNDDTSKEDNIIDDNDKKGADNLTPLENSKDSSSNVVEPELSQEHSKEVMGDEQTLNGNSDKGNVSEGEAVDNSVPGKAVENENTMDETCETKLLDKEENPDSEKGVVGNAMAQEVLNQRSEEVVEPRETIQNTESSTPVGENSQALSQVEKADTATSESDGDEPVTHLSLSQDDTSSSNSTSDEDENKTSQKSEIQEKNRPSSACESDDSEKSALVVDEKLKPHSNDNTEDTEMKTHDTASGEENFMETKSITSNEAPKDFLLDDTSTEKPVEKNTPENESGAIQEDDQPSSLQEVSDGIPLAGEDVPAMALTLEDKLELVSPQAVIKECVRTSCLNCVYCSHAVKIAVNGKQLALHLLAEHRYTPIKNNETSQDVIKKLKTSLVDLENLFFNTESYDSSDKSMNTFYDHTYECFQCRFVTTVHKELYVHKRKMHQKTVLLCVMCKANFYSYSELLCHMCPGIYVSEDINFRCCFCNLDMIPSAFRLMVHLRKSHHTCDICLEVAGDQQKLSTHMWKHKLNHLCYRCGIAYRNKPDITKHLFWKHGTESVLCKKCLQKKWPHVYHFCIPPTVFICEECNASFTKAVALKVHKRYHGGELPYGCSKCEVKFVSRKLLAKHEDTHNKPLDNKASNEGVMENKLDKSSEEHINVESVDEPMGESVPNDNTSKDVSYENGEKSESQALKSKKKKKRDKDRKGKSVGDVFDLPPLNLSSESDSSDEEAKTTKPESEKYSQPLQEHEVDNNVQEDKTQKQVTTTDENLETQEENQTPAPIVDGVWDNFHSYKAELEKRESKDLTLPNIIPSTSSPNTIPSTFLPDIVASTSSSNEKVVPTKTPEPETDWFLLDHSYCLIPGKVKQAENDNEPTISEPTPTEAQNDKPSEEIPAPRGHSSSIDHAYATITNSGTEGATTNATAPEQLAAEVRPSTPPAQAMPPSEPQSSPKKKPKTPKKKKHNSNSSSSSDSSSDSDSSCTCGPDCSCSNSSSTTSSSSSDSDSSASEGGQRTAGRREKKKEKLKHKHHKEETENVPEATPAPPAEEEPVLDAPAEPMELPVRESDLDTDESSTDEDFYDKCPQSHAKQQIENRNKLMLLASVAPVNNGTVSPPPLPPPPPAPAPVEDKPPPPPSAKRKTKTKRRRKSQQSKKQSTKANTQTQQARPNTVNLPMATSTPSHLMSNHQNITSKVASPLRTPSVTFHSEATTGSGSENESARLSKRKRVRNKFYGYSSDEEEEKPSFKWRKVETPSVPLQVQSPGLSFQQSYTHQRPQHTMPQVKKNKVSESSGSEDEPPQVKRDVTSNSSSSSSESENEVEHKDVVQKEQTEKSDNLYCYCQCPYDEVSEMIACDGQDCTIEWFHFECVGIMVPPKGKWYCPDCRKRRDLM